MAIGTAPELVSTATKDSGRNLLEVDCLVMHFPLTQGIIFQRKVGAVQAVDGISFEVSKGETLGLVGESGCGKSTTGRAILQLYKPTSGEVVFQGKDLTKLDGGSMRRMRRHLQMIFQDPYASLNPRMTVSEILVEPMTVHGIGSQAERADRVRELLGVVGLLPEHAQRYPHQFSGGQRQRVGIAMALANDPEIIIADEPTTALDVTVQAHILDLLRALQRERHMALLFITHDFGVVSELSDRIAVMHHGELLICDTPQVVMADPTVQSAYLGEELQ